jgi:hypothetical protein
MSPSVWVIIGNDNEAEVGPVNINQGGGICPKAQISEWLSPSICAIDDRSANRSELCILQS